MEDVEVTSSNQNATGADPAPTHPAIPGGVPAPAHPEPTPAHPEPRLAIMLPVTASGPELLTLAGSAAQAGIQELWVAEDLGLHGGVALVSTLLTAIPTVRIGLGIAPAAARHPAFLAMQAATLAQLYPGRLLLGIGHGMPGWMRQLGLWSRTPVARLEATLVAVRRLLDGEQVDLDRAGVLLDRVGLATAPVDVPLYAGVRGPQSLAACAPHVAGIVLAGWSGPAYIRWARERTFEAAGAPRRVVASARLAYDPDDPDAARQRLAHALTTDVESGGLEQQLAPTTTDPADPSLLAEVGIAGGQAALLVGLRRWWEAGADTVLLDPHTPDDLRRLLEDDLPLA